MKTVSTEQIRQIDRRAIEEWHIPSLFLMENAAAATAEAVRELLAGANDCRVAAVCGTGNNGGDGLACVRLLLGGGVSVTTYLVGNPEKLTADAAENLRRLQQMGAEVLPYTGQSLAGYDCIVDAIFGFGLNREVGGIYRQAIGQINAADTYVVSCDIPSGLNGDSGEAMGIAVKASRTVTFTYAKDGLVKASAQPYVGRITVADIGALSPQY